MSAKPSFGAKLRYSFENTLSKGPIAIIGWLAIISALVVFVVATIVYFMHLVPSNPEPKPGFWESCGKV